MFKQKLVIAAICVSLAASAAHAFLFEVPILSKAEISKLSDEKLADTYIDVVVELEALKAFYAKGGLVPKEYKQYKDILKYRIFLLQEVKKRKLEIPGLESLPEVTPPAENLEIKENKE